MICAQVQRPEELALLAAIGLHRHHIRRERAASLRRRDAVAELAAPRLVVDKLQVGFRAYFQEIRQKISAVKSNFGRPTPSTRYFLRRLLDGVTTLVDFHTALDRSRNSSTSAGPRRGSGRRCDPTRSCTARRRLRRCRSGRAAARCRPRRLFVARRGGCCNLVVVARLCIC